MGLSKNTEDLSSQVLIQISKNSLVKLEYDGTKLKYDRTLPIAMPNNYGTFLNSKIQEDGDLLDAVELSDEIIAPGKIIDLKDYDVVSIIDYYDDANLKDIKVILMKKAELKNSENLNKKIYQIANYINYLYYYKLKSSYITNVFYSPIFKEYGVDFRTRVNEINYKETNLIYILKELLSN